MKIYLPLSAVIITCLSSCFPPDDTSGTITIPTATTESTLRLIPSSEILAALGVELSPFGEVASRDIVIQQVKSANVYFNTTQTNLKGNAHNADQMTALVAALQHASLADRDMLVVVKTDVVGVEADVSSKLAAQGVSADKVEVISAGAQSSGSVVQVIVKEG